ncbi:hypothetical protein DFO50_11166 [Microvirgula sp. AG722]|nr:hypothetical protein DFO50_11166 [Microvirgula sp. AG722]
MAVKIRKHLLAPLQPSIQEKHDCNGFVSQFWGLLQGLFDRSSTVLAIIHDEPGMHIDRKGPHPKIDDIVLSNRFE